MGKLSLPAPSRESPRLPELDTGVCNSSDSKTPPPPIDTLFFLGRGPPREDPQENITIHLKIATMEQVKRGKKVEVILMHDATWWAEKDGEYGGLKAAAPDDDMTVSHDQVSAS